MQRRRFLKLSSVTSAVLFSSLLMDSSELNVKEIRKNLLTNDFYKKLDIPPLLEGKEIKGVYHYDLNIQEAEHAFFKNRLTNTYAVNGTYLAPTLKLINGQQVSINYTNNLKETTSRHNTQSIKELVQTGIILMLWTKQQSMSIKVWQVY